MLSESDASQTLFGEPDCCITHNFPEAALKKSHLQHSPHNDERIMYRPVL